MWTAQLLFPDDAQGVPARAVTPEAVKRHRQPASPRFHGPYYYC